MVAIISVDVTLAPEGVTDDGDNVQVAFDGAPLHESDTAELNPPAGEMVTV